MKNKFLLVLLFLCGSLHAQNLVPDTLLKKTCSIILSNKVILEVEIQKEDNQKLEYFDGKSLNDVLKQDVLRVDFKDYSLLAEKGSLKRIKYYDALVAANTYMGVITDKKNGQIFFAKKNNNNVRAYPGYTKFVEGATLYPIEQVVVLDNAKSVNEKVGLTDSLTIVEDSVRAHSSGNEKIAVFETKPLLSASLNGEIDPVTSYELGQQYAERTFEKTGVTVLSCLGTYCFPMPYILMNVNTKEIPLRDYPKGVNKFMFDEGYKNKIHQKRRKAITTGAAIGYGAITAAYLGLMILLLL